MRRRVNCPQRKVDRSQLTAELRAFSHRLNSSQGVSGATGAGGRRTLAEPHHSSTFSSSSSSSFSSYSSNNVSANSSRSGGGNRSASTILEADEGEDMALSRSLDVVNNVIDGPAMSSEDVNALEKRFYLLELQLEQAREALASAKEVDEESVRTNHALQARVNELTEENQRLCELVPYLRQFERENQELRYVLGDFFNDAGGGDGEGASGANGASGGNRNCGPSGSSEKSGPGNSNSK